MKVGLWSTREPNDGRRATSWPVSTGWNDGAIVVLT
jgi:hypothetical protein